MDFMQQEEIEDQNETKGVQDPRVYEVGYLLVPTIPEEDMPVIYGNLKEFVSSMGGNPIADEMPKMIPLAYTMTKVVNNARGKFNTAYFGWMKFTMGAEAVLELKKKLDLDPNIIRFLVLKTVAENTIAAKRFMRADLHSRRPRAQRSEDGAATPINKEEIDKEIDALVMP